MRNTEYTALVLQLLREGKTEKQIALGTQKHRNTVSRHVNWLRQNFAIEPQLLTNEVLSKLRERINQMQDRDLVRFLSVLMPQKIEQNLKVEDNRGATITSNLQEYEPLITREFNRTLQTDSPRKQVDSTSTTSEASTVPTA